MLFTIFQLRTYSNLYLGLYSFNVSAAPLRGARKRPATLKDKAAALTFAPTVTAPSAQELEKMEKERVVSEREPIGEKGADNKPNTGPHFSVKNPSCRSLSCSCVHRSSSARSRCDGRHWKDGSICYELQSDGRPKKRRRTCGQDGQVQGVQLQRFQC